jgi:hypothetical protein
MSTPEERLEAVLAQLSLAEVAGLLSAKNLSVYREMKLNWYRD